MSSSVKTAIAGEQGGYVADQMPQGAAPTAGGMYEELEQAQGRSRNFVKFAREKAHRDVARVKLLLCNNSKRQVEWAVKCANDVIQAIPSAAGLIKAFDNNECTLVWQRPKGLNSWREMSTLKMMLHVKLIVAETGKLVGEAHSKFRAVVDPEAVCTADEPPIHKMVLNSERSLSAPSKKKTQPKQSDAQTQVDTKTKDDNLLHDPQTTYWLLIFLLCLLAAFLLKAASEDDRNFIKFAVEKGKPDVAHVKLQLLNNSKRQIQWDFKCTESDIKAEPATSGRLATASTSEVNLTWQKPAGVTKWEDAPPPKMVLALKLIATESGKEVGDAFTKFKAMIDPVAECTTDDLPIHKMILNSNALPGQAEKDRIDAKDDADTESANPEGLLNDPDRLYWLIVFLCCCLAAFILRGLTNEDRRPSRRYDDDDY